ncbi:hypothetical protein WJX73_004873 [Symbiochloris irregularis]|uniref:Uncharacterized protein n=1 Tax=Symbiochloris irregularis TaxID=706552 RepID=A0AAW1PVJ4_9CHLO
MTNKRRKNGSQRERRAGKGCKKSASSSGRYIDCRKEGIRRKLKPNAEWQTLQLLNVHSPDIMTRALAEGLCWLEACDLFDHPPKNHAEHSIKCRPALR